ncbi:MULTISPECIES: helix-turn-helix domain-containing protein [Nitrospirillum]|uniref:Cytoskeletal protein RodZ n=4 Tax=Nitrospirillum TaxID=1543705 RepID=A0A560G0W0_9PROT|nr:helix-turn-helix domain-containing protein [Nitrospirillum amazonense]TWB23938.1 cytoskeletal protein RodZ [Nitrospirillum amazonense]TWB27536.1 cytoskeletal protein RodZ [Nitrospirillum amazonense]
MTERRDRYRDMIDAGRAAEPQAPRETVGDILRMRREELGYDLTGVANVLRIRRPYLEAIEDGRYGDLPGQAYILGFLRSYADLLGIDSGDLLNRFKDETAGHVRPAELYLPIPVSENRVPSGALIVGAVVLAAALYGGWYLYSSADRSALDLVPKLPERLAHLTGNSDASSPPPANVLPAPAVQALLNQAQPTAPEVGAAPDATAPLPDAMPGPVPAAPANAPAAPQAPATNAPAGQGTAAPPAAPGKTATAPQSAAPQQTTSAPVASEAPDDEAPQMPDLGQPKTAAADPDAAPADASMRPDTTAPGAVPAPAKGRVFGQTGPARVVVRATDESWIQVRDAKGTLWASRVLHPGDSFRAPDVPGLTLETGNAGGVVVSLDGKDLAALGAKGQVVRSYPLQPDDLQARVTH